MHFRAFEKSGLAKILTERCAWEYNTVRSHSPLGYRLPGPEIMKLSLPGILTSEVVQLSGGRSIKEGWSHE